MLSIKQFEQDSAEPDPTPRGASDAASARQSFPASGDDAARRAAPVPVRPGSDEYDAMLWRIKPAVDRVAGGFRLGVAGSRRRSGASTVAANLAIRAADLGLGPALLVDANFDFPAVDRIFRAASGPGLADACIDGLMLADVVRPSGTPHLDLAPAGRVERLSRAGLNSDVLCGLLREATETYEFLVFDLPAAENLGPSLPLAQALDAALLVLRSDSVSGAAARRAASRLAADGVPLSGAVLAQRRPDVPLWLRRWL